MCTASHLPDTSGGEIPHADHLLPQEQVAPGQRPHRLALLASQLRLVPVQVRKVQQQLLVAVGPQQGAPPLLVQPDQAAGKLQGKGVAHPHILQGQPRGRARDSLREAAGSKSARVSQSDASRYTSSFFHSAQS